MQQYILDASKEWNVSAPIGIVFIAELGLLHRGGEHDKQKHYAPLTGPQRANKSAKSTSPDPSDDPDSELMQ